MSVLEIVTTVSKSVSTLKDRLYANAGWAMN